MLGAGEDPDRPTSVTSLFDQPFRCQPAQLSSRRERVRARDGSIVLVRDPRVPTKERKRQTLAVVEAGGVDGREPGDRLVEHERHDFLRPTVVHCTSPEPFLANSEYMFPFASVVECPQDQMIKQIGSTLVGTAITEDAKWSQQLLDATNIDRLNLGPIRTMALNWLQPHEGNLTEFLFRNRAVQTEAPAAH